MHSTVQCCPCGTSWTSCEIATATLYRFSGTVGNTDEHMDLTVDTRKQQPSHCHLGTSSVALEATGNFRQSPFPTVLSNSTTWCAKIVHNISILYCSFVFRRLLQISSSSLRKLCSNKWSLPSHPLMHQRSRKTYSRWCSQLNELASQINETK